jgi:carboxypeptidase Taq
MKYRSNNSKVNVLLNDLAEHNTYSRIGNLLRWDLETQLPGQGIELRTEELAKIDVLSHQAFLNINKNSNLENLSREIEDLSEEDQIIVREVKREYEKQAVLPDSLVKKISKCSSSGTIAWQKSLKSDDSTYFLPKLEEMIDLKKQVIKHRNTAASPYDVLLDEYEPGLTTNEIRPVLEQTKSATIDLLDSLPKKQNQINLSHNKIFIPVQHEFNDYISELVGFDFNKGVSSVSTHPFTSQQSPNDVRFTSRYKTGDVLYAISSTMHETGHALYEQNLPYQKYGTPLAQYISLGVHESQSRFYENQIGRSKEFAEILAKELSNRIDIKFTSSEIYHYYNTFAPSLIRVEADELTYNLHIVIRFEIENAIFNENLKVGQIEDMWNNKYKEYLGVTPNNLSEGFLQDVHWSQGLFGYFPTYTLGSIYAAQITTAMQNQIGDLSDLISNQSFETILTWLDQNIYKYGKTYNATELIEKITGNKLDAGPLIFRLKNKVDSISSD